MWGFFPKWVVTLRALGEESGPISLPLPYVSLVPCSNITFRGALLRAKCSKISKPNKWKKNKHEKSLLTSQNTPSLLQVVLPFLCEALQRLVRAADGLQVGLDSE